MTTQTVMPTLARALFERIAAHLKEEAARRGYSHPEHYSGPDFPATDVPCITETIAEAIIEKHLMEILGDTPCEPYFVEAPDATHRLP